VFDDEILRIRYRFVREYDASDAFFHAICAQVGAGHQVCDEHQARIGDARVEQRASWLKSAPTAIGAQGITLGDGRHVAFALDKATLRSMTVTELGGSVKTYEPLTNFERDSNDRLTLWFGANGELGWTSEATLVTKPAAQ
jgi:hypothetical protein